MFLQSTLSNNYTIGTGLKWDNVDLSESIPILGLERERNSYLIYHAFLDFDSFNKSFRPTAGFVFKAKLNVIANLTNINLEDASSVISAQFTKAVKLTDKIALNVGLDGAATIGALV